MGINQEFAKLLNDMADILELKGIEWKPQAYRKAARVLDSLDKDVSLLYKEKGKKGLVRLSAIGSGIADHIIEYVETGKVKKFGELEKKAPKGSSELMHVEGLGPQKVKILISKLGVHTVPDLRKAIKSGKLEKLEGFGKKTSDNLLKSLLLFEKGQERMLLGIALPLAESIVGYLRENAPVEWIEYAGSLRRMKETIGDIDVLVISRKSAAVMSVFTKMPNVTRVIAHGVTKSTVILKEGVHVDLRVVGKESKSAALNYFIGSKDHNIALRQEAIKKGYKLSEYGLFSKKTGKAFSLGTEKELYKKLGFQYVPPELREMRGELTAAKKGKLPKLISYLDIKGDLHVHTKFSDGIASISEMVQAAADMGYSYVAITDHSPSERIANGLSADRLKKQWKEIDKAGKKVKIKILKGSEVDILKDGSLDYPDEILKKLDVTVCSVHSRFKVSRKEQTERICTALSNKYLDILGHPTGRLIGTRAPYEVDLRKVFVMAADHKKVIEINAQPQRLDLNDVHIMMAKEMGLKFCINTDSHTPGQLHHIRYGVGQARRGWLEKKDIVNTLPLSGLKKYFTRIS